MPGYVMHLAVAEQLIDTCHITDIKKCNRIRIGSIVPDIKKGSEKKKSHFWTDEEFIRFARKPDLQMFMDKYGNRIWEPYIFGYYAHLYMDYRFMVEYWPLHYKFYDENMQPIDVYDKVKWVQYIDGDELIPRQDFFSEQYYYGDYNRMNRYMIQHYEIQTPQYQSGIIEDGGVEEVEDMESGQILQNMISFLEHTAMVQDPKQRQTAGEVQQNLKAFSLSGMQQLIEQTALQLSTIYKKVIT